MYIRDSLVHPFTQSFRPGSSVTPIAPSRFTYTFGEPPVASAPPVPMDTRRINNKLVSICIETPVPRLLAQKDNTLFVEIPLGIDDTFKDKKGKEFQVKPWTAIFVPDGHKAATLVNLIIYFHGHTNTYPGDGASIDEYLDAKKFPFFGLREGINASGRKDVILVAPTLGPRSQAGCLPCSPDAYFDQVLLALRNLGSYQNLKLRFTNIILASHSGGGSPMRRIALAAKRYRSNIQECWGFDALNGGSPETKEWIAWGKANPTKKLYVYYCDYADKNGICRSTKVNSENLKRHPDKPQNVTVEKSTARNHFWVPLAHWTDRIQKTVFPPKP